MRQFGNFLIKLGLAALVILLLIFISVQIWLWFQNYDKGFPGVSACYRHTDHCTP
jgi:hypothetical protein